MRKVNGKKIFYELYNGMNINFNINNHNNTPVFAKRVPKVSEEVIRRYVAQNMSSEEISILFGKSHSWGAMMMKKFGLQNAKRERIANFDKIIPDMIRNNQTAQQIAECLGVSIVTVRNWVKKYFGMTFGRKREEIKNLLANEHDNEYIAGALGVSAEEVPEIRKKWAGSLNEIKKEALACALKGLSIKEIAARLNISVNRAGRYAAQIDKTLRRKAKAKKKQAALQQAKINANQKAYEHIKQCIQGGVELSEALKTTPSGHKMSCREAYKLAAQARRKQNSNSLTEKILVRISSGMTIKEIAAELGLTVPKTTYYAEKGDILEAKRLKVRLRKGYILTQINQGKKLSEIAQEMGCTMETLYRYLGGEERSGRNERRLIIANKIMKCIRQDKSLEEIAVEMNLSVLYVKRYLEFYNHINS